MMFIYVCFLFFDSMFFMEIMQPFIKDITFFLKRLEDALNKTTNSGLQLCFLLLN